jgi:hypothetical protein
MKTIQLSLRICAVCMILMVLAWGFKRYTSFPFAGFALALTAGAAALTFAPLLVLAAWRDRDTIKTRSERLAYTALGLANSFFCAMFFSTQFTHANDAFMLFARIGAVLCFFLVFRALVRDFDKPAMRLFMFSSMSMYFLSSLV